MKKCIFLIFLLKAHFHHSIFSISWIPGWFFKQTGTSYRIGSYAVKWIAQEIKCKQKKLYPRNFSSGKEFIFYNVKNVMSDIYIKCELLFRVNRAYPFDLLRYIVPFSINYPTIPWCIFSQLVVQLSYYNYISHVILWR